MDHRPDDPELLAARRDLAAARRGIVVDGVANYARKAVDRAGPFAEPQIQRIITILRSGGAL